jgi:recombinational DNA repair ATPase RecF
MNKYYISNLTVKRLWGDKDKTFDLDLDPYVNIIIGRNASGKTTLINILHYALTANILALAQIDFSEISITLQSFDSEDQKNLIVVQDDEKTSLSFEGIVAVAPMDEVRLGGLTGDVSMYRPAFRRRFQYEVQHVRDVLADCVPAVWLPVSRRLPIADEEDAERRRLHKKPLESVDECLEGLLEGLQSYRVMLDVQLSELRKDFQKHALETILFDKQHDKYTDIRTFVPPSDEEKNQLLQAFTDVGLMDAKIKKRIDEHF